MRSALAAFFLVFFRPSPTAPAQGLGGSINAANCISGFMSLDRIHAVLDNFDDSAQTFGVNGQVIIPGINFTCSGSILSWVFGAQWQWQGNTDSFTELQIWRPGSVDGSYTKVASTTIMVQRNRTRLYEYRLSSPLAFQAGDVLGYYQDEGQLRFLFEEVNSGHPMHYYRARDHSRSQVTLNVDNSLFEDQYRLLIRVETDSPGCGCGFMSVERMKILLGLDRVEGSIDPDQRQQITPDMRFTCDGVITKWIIGADWFSWDDFYPEMQLWRKSGSNVYQKISGTLIDIDRRRNDQVYEYSNFQPIPVQAGDVLGIFMPEDQLLVPIAEEERGPMNYYICVEDSAVSPFSTFNIRQRSVESSVYHPLVSVEFVVNSPTSILAIATSTLAGTPVPSLPTPSFTPTTFLLPSTTPTLLLSLPSPTPPPSVSRPSPAPTEPGPADDGTIAIVVYLTVAVSGTVMLLIVAAVTVMSCVHRYRRKSKGQVVKTRDNIAYCVGITENREELQLSHDHTYSTSSVKQGTGSTVYDYPANSGGNNNRIATFPNQAYALSRQAADRAAHWGNSRAN